MGTVLATMVIRQYHRSSIEVLSYQRSVKAIVEIPKIQHYSQQIVPLPSINDDKNVRSHNDMAITITTDKIGKENSNKRTTEDSVATYFPGEKEHEDGINHEVDVPVQEEMDARNDYSQFQGNLGTRWKNLVRKKLKQREQELRHSSRGPRRERIVENFQRLRSRLEEISPDDQIDDPSKWHTVTPDSYQETVNKARASLDEMVSKVNTDCVLWLEPPSFTTVARINKNGSHPGPELKFECTVDASSKTEEHVLVLQDKPCDSANLCLVKTDLGLWEDYYSEGGIRNSQRNFSEIKQQQSNSDTTASSLLTMVDSIEYLRNGQQGTNKKGQHYIWRCFLNKASYAMRTNRNFYIWIGALDNDQKLHHRETETVARTFGTNCNPESVNENTIHYYKPIAFGALFSLLDKYNNNNKQQKEGLGEERRVWFVDADIFFNGEAFLGSHDDDDILSLDDYFDISPQASLLGSQNPSGKDENILINGGLLGLRSKSSKSNESDWILDFSALWWYCRCGERDQIALWLLLFATWSAESTSSDTTTTIDNRSSLFSYPGVIFESYLFAWYGVIPHARRFLPQLQQSWMNYSAAAAAATTPTASSSTSSSWRTAPTNATLFDGGHGFLKSSLGGAFTYPLELPHVLLLPLDPFVLPPSQSSTPTHHHRRRNDFYLGIVKKNQREKKSLLTHSKNMYNMCYNSKCWPFSIPEGPIELHDLEATKVDDSTIIQE